MHYYNGQSSSEFQKNYRRVEDIITKSLGDLNKQEKLAQQQANLIKDEWKAINRAMVAKKLGHMNIYEIFFRKAYELGSVPTQEFREYILSKLLQD